MEVKYLAVFVIRVIQIVFFRLKRYETNGSEEKMIANLILFTIVRFQSININLKGINFWAQTSSKVLDIVS